MKKLLVSLFVPVLIVTTVVTPVLASPPPVTVGTVDAEVTVSPIDVEGTLTAGEKITLSGTVTTTSIASIAVSGGTTKASSYACYDINGVVIDSNVEVYWGCCYSTSNASQIFSWVYTFNPEAGMYTVTQYGQAYAEWYLDDAHNDLKIVENGDSVTFSILEPAPTSAAIVNPDNDYWLQWEDGFAVVIGSDGLLSGVDMENQATLQDLTEIGFIGADTYKLFIPTGTVVSSLGSGSRPDRLVIVQGVDEGSLFFVQSLEFSQPVVLSKLVGGTWVVVAEFAKVASGQWAL